MKKPSSCKLLILGLILILPNVSPALTISVDRSERYQILGSGIYYLEDPVARLDISQVMDASGWQVFQGREINFGFTKSCYWIRFTLRNESSSEANLLLENKFPLLDYFDVYLTNSGEVLSHYELGDSKPLASRPILHSTILIPVDMAANSSIDIYIRAQSETAIQLPLRVWHRESYITADHFRSIWLGMFFGLLVAMSVYHLLVFFSVQERSFLYFGFFNLSLVAIFSTLHGYFSVFTNTDAKFVADNFMLASIASSMSFGLLFINSILKLPEAYPWAAKFFYTFAASGLVAVVCCFLLDRSMPALPILALNGASMIPIVAAIIKRMFDRYSIAYYIFVGVLLAVVGTSFTILDLVGLIPNSAFAESAIYMGIIFLCMFDAFALAHRINLERLLRQETQSKLVESQNQLNQELDKLVKNRTEELEQANLKLQELSQTDGLTQLYNRRYFSAVFEQEFKRAAREKTPLSLLLMDIDHFKHINDTYGHPFGDVCLKHAAGILSNSVRRPPDTVARYGGEEFVILLPSTDITGSEYVANNILLAFNSTRVEENANSIIVTVSIGVVSIIPSANCSTETMLKSADELLYRAKRNGRNRVEAIAL